MIDVHVEQGRLDGGVDMVCMPLKNGRIRMLYDPGRITETGALDELHLRMPQLDGTRIVRSSRA